MIEIDTRLFLEFEILGCGYFSFWYTSITGKETLITIIPGYEWISWTSCMYLTFVAAGKLCYSWERLWLSHSYSYISYVVKRQEYQAATKNISSIYVPPINWTIFFPHLCSSSLTPRSSFIQKMAGPTQTKYSFSFSYAGNHFPFVYFLSLAVASWLFFLSFWKKTVFQTLKTSAFSKFNPQGWRWGKQQAINFTKIFSRANMGTCFYIINQYSWYFLPFILLLLPFSLI